MRILYVVSRPLELNTSASLRNINTINALAVAGHTIDVLTSEYSKKHSNYGEVTMNNNVNVKYLKPSNIKRAASLTHKIKWLKKIRNLLYRKINQISVYDNYKSLINNIDDLDFRDKDYNLIISSSDPKSSHLVALEIILKEKIKNVPWIQIWGDPFVNDITRNQTQTKNQIMLEEKRLLKYATSVIYLSYLTLLEQQKVYHEFKNKMFFVPRPYEKEVKYDENKINKNSGFSLVYCGDYNSSVRDLNPLYNAIKETGDSLTICGYSDKPLISTEKIKVDTRVAFSKVLELEEKSDVLVHLSNLNGTQIPGKIYQYSATNKPILFILDGEVDAIYNEFNKYNRYVFCENNSDSIREAIRKIKQSNDLPAQLPVKEFSKDIVIKKILSTVEVIL